MGSILDNQKEILTPRLNRQMILPREGSGHLLKVFVYIFIYSDLISDIELFLFGILIN